VAVRGTETGLERLAERYGTAEEFEDATAAASPEAPPGAERITTFAVLLPAVVLDHIRAVAAHHNLTRPG